MRWGFRRRLQPTYANVVASLALFIALGGVSWAAVTLPKNSVGSKQIKKGAVSSSKIANNAISSSKVKNGSLQAADFKKGELSKGVAVDGANGAAGAQGPKGDKGDRGPSGANGTNGLNGLPGTDGTNGNDGASGATAFTNVVPVKAVGDATANGAALRTAAGAASSGTLLLLDVASYDLGNDRLGLPAGVSMAGQGRGLTYITQNDGDADSLNGIAMSGGSTLRDFTLSVSSATSVVAVTNVSPAPHVPAIERIEIIASAASGINSAVGIYTSTSMTVRDALISVDGPTNPLGGPVGVLVPSGSTAQVTVERSRIVAAGSTSVARGVSLFGAGAGVVIKDSAVNATGASGSAVVAATKASNITTIRDSDVVGPLPFAVDAGTSNWKVNVINSTMTAVSASTPTGLIAKCVQSQVPDLSRDLTGTCT